MRLLAYNNEGELSLTQFFDSIPQYAILSHTWGPEEFTFRDLMEGNRMSKTGYKKIRFCGEQAGRDRIQYFWVDTCCIDQSNNNELAEAINSMFRWYRDANKCYVYLSDVSGSISTDNNNSYQLPWESAFRASRWFTRGWTLQELLAPTSVEFFSQHNKRLGDKRTLKRYIHEITGIPMLALEGAPLSQFEVDERFSWAENRQTTRREDKAYSLLGIFGIYLPLIYGEGREHAFKRLKKEIQNSLKEENEQHERYLPGPQSRSCIQDLQTTDPREDKKRIEKTKGGLLQDSYQWIVEHPDFHRWRKIEQGNLLWIKGDPGKGKTMLLCGIIDEISALPRLKDKNETTLLSYFFCQATDSRINNAVAVLRGLVYLLIEQRPLLIKHIREKYDHAGKMLFEDTNVWIAMTEIFTNILQDLSLENMCLLIDALDECVIDLPKLLDFIVQTSSTFPHIKWIVSSRNWPIIESTLDTTTQKLRLSLELNEESVSAAIATFIQFKVNWLATRNKYDSDTREAIQQYLTQNANGTFFWVALVCQELSNIPGHKALQKLIVFSPGLNALYRRILDQIMDSEYTELCKSILAIVSVVYRPVTLDELVAFVDMPNGVASKYKALSELIGLCGSFLKLHENTISFVHQSAKDFLISQAANDIFPSGLRDIHYTIFLRSLHVMHSTLRRDIYSLGAPGISIDQVKQPDPDPLAAARYSYVYWIDHLLDCNTRENVTDALKDGGSVYSFLCHNFLYWLEALSLIRSISGGIIAIKRLEDWLQVDKSPDLYAFIHDARRFAIYNRSIIEQAPLQSYCSALIFSPENSIIRVAFEKCIPAWIEGKPKIQAHWIAVLQTLEGHSDKVNSVAFSPDGKQVVSSSDDHTVRLWDATTGATLQVLEGHSGCVTSVAFSPDGKQVVSGSDDHTVRLWDATIGAALQMLEGHSDNVNSVAYSPDAKQVVSGSDDHTVRLWDATIGAALQTLEGHSDNVNSVAFSPDGKQVVSSSDDCTVRLWDATIGATLQTLEGHSSWVTSVAFSPDGKQVASSSSDCTVRLWDATTGATLQTLEGHLGWVTSVAFSPDGKQVVSSSDDHTVRLWDATGATLQVLEGHSDWVTSVAFSPDGKQVVSSSSDHTIRFWDATIRGTLQTLEGHSDKVNSVAFSPDGKQVVSGSDDHTVRLWDAATGAMLQTLEGHSGSVTAVAFSPDGKQVVSGSIDYTVRLWDTTTGAALRMLWGHSDLVTSIAFSSDGKLPPTLHLLNNWLVEGITNVLWLPVDYRPTCEAVWDRTVVLGYSSGRISFIEIKKG